MPRIKHTTGLRKRTVRKIREPIIDDAFGKGNRPCVEGSSDEPPSKFLNLFKERRFHEIRR